MAPGTIHLNIFSWNTRLARYAMAGQYEKTIDLFQLLQKAGVIPDKYTFIPVLNACSSLGAIEQGRRLHMLIIQNGCESNVYLGSSLVNMYAKCGCMEEAWEVFDKLPGRDGVVWNAMILGCVRCGQGQKALELYRDMKRQGIEPTPITFVVMVNACAAIVSLEEGRQVHQHVIQSGYESHVFVATSLIDMYTKCGSVENAWKVFNKMPTRSVVSWNVMIQGLVRCGQGKKALYLYQQMQHEGVKPGPVSFVGALNACATIEALEEGRHVHKQIIQEGCVSDPFVNNSLVDMYVKCGSIEDAWRVFHKMPTHDVVAWNSLILGHVKCSKGHMALKLFQQMQLNGVEPDSATFVATLNACASLLALEEGRSVHQQIDQHSCGSEVFVGNSLIDMYAKCGSIEDARRVFNKMPRHDIVSWNAMLGGYAMHGHTNEALQHFNQMLKGGVEINRVTFICLLSACSHGGLVDEGLQYYEFMSSVCRVSATVEHYACMVDLLGRSGRLHEADDLMKAMSCESNEAVWKALLSACRVHGNMEI